MLPSQPLTAPLAAVPPRRVRGAQPLRAAVLLAAGLLLLAGRARATSVLECSSRTDPTLLPFLARQRGSSCERTCIPWNFCTACPLKPFVVRPDGEVVWPGALNRFDIYDLSSARCRRKMQRYVENNACDTKRAQTLPLIDTDENARLTWIYFMYAVCETCCDCIPIGARVEEYEDRKKNGTLINVFRGNCPAHFRYDTCVVWRDVSLISGCRSTAARGPDKWCPDFVHWQGTPNANRWLRNNNVKGMTQPMIRAMRQLAKRARCTEEKTWKDCVRMEHAQRRV